MSNIQDTEPSWNVFIPHRLLYKRSGYITGSYCQRNRFICLDDVKSSLDSVQAAGSALCVLGCWTLEGGGKWVRPSTISSSPCLLQIQTNRHGSISDCSLRVLAKTKSKENVYEPQPVTCVIFDPEAVLSSYILYENSRNECTSGKDKLSYAGSHSRPKEEAGGDSNQASDKRKLSLTSSHPDLITSLLIEHLKTLSRLSKIRDSKENNLNCIQRGLSWWANTHPLLHFFKLLMWLYCCFGSCVKRGSEFITSLCPYVFEVLNPPSIVSHLRWKSDKLRQILRLDLEHEFNVFMLYTSFSQLFVDSCLGLIVVFFFSHWDVSEKISLVVLDWADDVAKELSALIEWLMVGAPAGLKLNAQLTKFMGHFYVYHIYLWTGYLEVLRKVMPSVLWYCSLIGGLGLSTQICLVKDILSMLTLHIYCFYVYAARIFNLQVSVLRSLWRLFRGKKWNVLRSRVDSAAFNTDQLFIGTLLFTVLLFLLPTTALYYVVFTLLRLSVITVQGVMSKVVFVISSTPIFTIILRLLRPCSVAGNIRFQMEYAANRSYFSVLSMQTCQIPFRKLLGLTSSLQSWTPSSTLTWWEFICHLGSGRLIYPWVEPRSDSDFQVVGARGKAD